MSARLYGFDPAPYGVDTSSAGFWQWLTTVYEHNSSETNVKTVTAAYSGNIRDRVILMDGDINVTLPDPSSCSGKIITCKAINSGTGTRTVTGAIDGGTNVTTTTQYDAFSFASDGVAWWKI